MVGASSITNLYVNVGEASDDSMAHVRGVALTFLLV